MTGTDLGLSHEASTVTVGVVLLAFLVALVFGWKTPETLAFLALIVVWNAGILTTTEAISGFANKGVLAIGALFVVVKGTSRSQFAERACRHVFGLKTGARQGLLRMMLVVFFLSALLNNTPIVALMVPVVRDWARSRGFATTMFLIPLCYATVLGGLLSMVGSSSNLVVQGVIYEADLARLGMFDIGLVGLPAGLLGIAFMALVSPWLLSGKGTGLLRYIRDRAHELVTEVELDSNFSGIGQPIETALAVLGLPPHSIIKIRRPSRAEPSLLNGLERTASPSPDNGRRYSGPLAIPRALLCCTRDEAGDLEEGGLLSPDIEIASQSLHGLEPPQPPDSLSGSYQSLPQEDEAALLKYGTFASDEFVDLFPVSPDTKLRAGDILFLGCPRWQMMELQGKTITLPIRGLRFLDVQSENLRTKGRDFFELVLSGRNSLVGTGRVSTNHLFQQTYNCTVLAVRQAYWPTSPEGSVNGADLDGKQLEAGVHPKFTEVRNRPLEAGDTVLVLARADFKAIWAESQEFFVITKVGDVPAPIRWLDYVPLVLFVGMLAWVTICQVDMVQGAMLLAAILVAGGWLDARQAVAAVDWPLLLLVGSALGLGKAITKSGMSGYLADGIRHADISPLASLALVFLFTAGITQVITNNAAAALAAPIAIEIASALNVDHRPFMITVILASSSAFLTPIGYQCNTMVWRPGNYKFSDYPKVGLGLLLINAAAALWLTPQLFPF